MAIDKKYLSDHEVILSHQYDNGADYRTTPDRCLIKGSPFSTLDSVLYLLELGMEPKEPLLKECADLITWREDGSMSVQDDLLNEKNNAKSNEYKEVVPECNEGLSQFWL